MKNKVLIKLIVPELDSSFDVFIPVNELVWKVKKLMIKSVYDLSGKTFEMSKDFYLINQDNGRVYDNNEIVIETDIRNATELLAISIK